MDSKALRKDIFPPESLKGHESVYLPFSIQWAFSMAPEENADFFMPVESGAPTVAQDQVFIGSHYGDFFCLDRETGKVNWKFKAFGGIESASTVFKGNVLFGDSD